MHKACLPFLLAAALALAPAPVRAASQDDQLFIGTEALLRGRFELAAQSFAAALAADPDNPYARTRLGLALAGTGQMDQARAELEKALAARADDLFALWSLGCLDLLADQPTAAAGRFAAMAKADPGNVRSLLGQGLATLEQGRTAEGVGLLAKVQQAESGDALVRFLTGYAYWRLDAPANARLELEAALELEPRNTAALELLGLVYRRQGHAHLAASAWGQALTINPNAAGARFFLSRLAEDEGLAAALADRPAEAKRAYERALAVDPGNAAAAKALGLAVMPPLAVPGAGNAPHKRGGETAAPSDPGKKTKDKPTAPRPGGMEVQPKTGSGEKTTAPASQTPSVQTPDVQTPPGQTPVGPTPKPFVASSTGETPATPAEAPAAPRAKKKHKPAAETPSDPSGAALPTPPDSAPAGQASEAPVRKSRKAPDSSSAPAASPTPTQPGAEDKPAGSPTKKAYTAKSGAATDPPTPPTATPPTADSSSAPAASPPPTQPGAEVKPAGSPAKKAHTAKSGATTAPAAMPTSATAGGAPSEAAPAGEAGAPR